MGSYIRVKSITYYGMITYSMHNMVSHLLAITMITDFVIFVISFYIARIVSMMCECFVLVIIYLSQFNLVK